MVRDPWPGVPWTVACGVWTGILVDQRITDHGPRTTDHGPRTTDHGPRTMRV